jgi:hypothetical protein
MGEMVQITMDEHGNIAAWATDVHDTVVFDGFNKVIAAKDAKIKRLRGELERLQDVVCQEDRESIQRALTDEEE